MFLLGDCLISIGSLLNSLIDLGMKELKSMVLFDEFVFVICIKPLDLDLV